MTTETARVEAFSDGVFAIAITLLILEIKVPSAGSGDLAGQLLRQWPSYLSFFISFAFIGIMWINHHRLFTHIRKSDDVLLVLNLALMLGVTIIPFTTSVLAAHLGHSGARTAVIVYDAAYRNRRIFQSTVALCRVSQRTPTGTDVDRAAADKLTQQYNLGPLAYLLAIALAWVSITASLLINLLLAFFFAIPPQYATKPVPKPRAPTH